MSATGLPGQGTGQGSNRCSGPRLSWGAETRPFFQSATTCLLAQRGLRYGRASIWVLLRISYSSVDPEQLPRLPEKCDSTSMARGPAGNAARQRAGNATDGYEIMYCTPDYAHHNHRKDKDDGLDAPTFNSPDTLLLGIERCRHHIRKMVRQGHCMGPCWS